MRGLVVSGLGNQRVRGITHYTLYKST